MDVAVVDDLDVVAQGSRKSRPRPGRSDAHLRKRKAERRPVVDDEAEVRSSSGPWVRPVERAMNWSPRSMNARSRLGREAGLEQPAPEGERLVDVADLERYMIDADQTRLAAPLLARHFLLLWFPTSARSNTPAAANGVQGAMHALVTSRRAARYPFDDLPQVRRAAEGAVGLGQRGAVQEVAGRPARLADQQQAADHVPGVAVKGRAAVEPAVGDVDTSSSAVEPIRRWSAPARSMPSIRAI